MPVLIAGNAIDLSPFSSARFRLLMAAFFNFSTSCPSPHFGPTAWMTKRAGKLPAEVIAAFPTGQAPI